MTDRKTMFELADRVGVHISTYSPGDGVTRYRFTDKRSEPEWNWDYFATSHPMYTALGLKEASTWLLGYAAGTQNKWKREQYIEGS